MNRPDGLDKYAQPVNLVEGATSYFSAPEAELDPKLFSGDQLKGWVRNGIMQLLFDFLHEVYRNADTWTHVWIAGSGVSYQWSAARQPGDLDVLIGIDYINFRRANPEYAGLGDAEISQMLNEEFREHLYPETADWNGYEVTFYVNPGATDIRSINPYAAYDLTHNKWTVTPSHEGAPQNAVWDMHAERDAKLAKDIVTRYSKALTDFHGAQNDASRRNAENRLQQALTQGSALYDDIHTGRKYAFSKNGAGYADFYNYRWQAGKKYGTVPALRSLHDYLNAYNEGTAEENYGVKLPDTNTLVRRAATYRAKG